MIESIDPKPNQTPAPSLDQKSDPTPLVSVIMIFFNAKQETFFEEAIDSILAQTYDHWELLLADDGSTDASTTIAQQYAQRYPHKLRYIEHPGHQNRGMSATRNLGIRHAQGNYIAFLDADDLWLPHKLEQQVPLLLAHPEAAMLYGRTQYWFSWFQPHHADTSALTAAHIQDDSLTITSHQFDTLIPPPTQIHLILKNPDIYPCTCSVLIRRSTLETLGGFEEDFRNANEDMVFHSKVFLNFPVYVSSQWWDRYRRHSESYWGRETLAGKGVEAARKGRLKYLTWLEAYLRQHPTPHREIQPALKHALFACRYPRLERFVDRCKHPQRTLNNLFQKIQRKFIGQRLQRES